MSRQSISSWDIVNDQIVIKHCDATIYNHGLIAVIKQLEDFFNVQGMAPHDHRTITIDFKGEQYEANIGEDERPRCRLSVGKQIRKELDQKYKESKLLDLMIQKKDNIYYFSFIEEDEVLKSLDDDLTTSITISSKLEGKKKLIYTTKYERDPKLRNEAIKIHGLRCCVCDFDFEQRYGSIGKNFIEVHHLKPLHSLCHEEQINPDTDMACLCSNCHRMIHRKKNKILTPDELKELLH